MVAPLRPLITPLTLSLCAAAAPQCSSNAAKARIILNAFLNLFLFMFIPPQLFRGPLLNPRLSPRAGNLWSPRLRGPTGRRRFVEQVDQRFGSGHNRLRAFHNVLRAEVLAVESPVGVIIRIHRRPLD